MNLMKRTVLIQLLCLFPVAGAGEITKLILIDAGNDRPIGPLNQDAIIDLAQTNRGINVDVETTGTVESVRYGLNDNPSYHTESVPPFAMYGDDEGNYGEWIPKPGTYTVTATPYTEKGAKGKAGQTARVSFAIIGSPKRAKAGPTPMPSQYADISSGTELGHIPDPVGGKADVSGTLQQWHPVVLTFDGPATSETANPNPYLHYRLNVTFTQGNNQMVIPGYYAGNGQGGAEGNKWRVKFAPPQAGTWIYQASFRAGFNVNASLDPEAGKPTACDNARGLFVVEESDKGGDDFRASEHGLLINRGDHYLTFGGGGKAWLKSGPDIPENFMGYVGFENSPNAQHTYAFHAKDWSPGDPDWDQGQGKCIIGALNYIAQNGGNCIYFLPMNIGGDGKDTFPTIAPFEKTRYDNSKLRQWEIVFAHAQSLGVFLHFQLAETENANENYHDQGTLGPERKLYYREMVARFGHHNGMQFNLGEENDYSTETRVQFARFIKAIDPYSHPVAVHTHGGKEESTYDPFIEILRNGQEVGVDMTSFQGGKSRQDMANLMIRFRKLSQEVGFPWVMSYDEPQPIHNDLSDETRGHPNGRRSKMWPCFMGGGAGFEWYIQEDGGGHGLDQRIDDFGQIQATLQWSGYVRDFLYHLPLKEVSPQGELGRAAQGETYVLAKVGEIYAVFNDRCGQDFNLDLRGVSGRYTVGWFDPRYGGDLQKSTVAEVTGGGWRSLGKAPADLEEDWACLVQRVN
ncbi:DUF5060 domain-containing protein [Planctomycetota bacterium]